MYAVIKTDNYRSPKKKYNYLISLFSQIPKSILRTGTRRGIICCKYNPSVNDFYYELELPENFNPREFKQNINFLISRGCDMYICGNEKISLICDSLGMRRFIG